MTYTSHLYPEPFAEVVLRPGVEGTPPQFRRHQKGSASKGTSEIRADFWEGDATKHISVKKGVFSEKGRGNSVNQGFGKDFYRKGNSVKSFGPFIEPSDSENWKVAILIPFPKISSYENRISRRNFTGRVKFQCFFKAMPHGKWLLDRETAHRAGRYRFEMSGFKCNGLCRAHAKGVALSKRRASAFYRRSFKGQHD